METELQQWICETVIVEAQKLLRLTLSGVSDSKQKSLQGTTKDYDNATRVRLSGTRVVQIIDFNGQRKAPFTNISVSDVSCQIRASLSEAARKQFEKKYDRRLPHRTVGAIFEVGGCSLLFNPLLKGAPRVTLSINSLILKGGEGSSNLGFPAPIEEIEDVRDLITRMKNTTPPQANSSRSRYMCSSPIHSLAESPSGDEIGSPNGQLATQAPLPSDTYDERGKAKNKPAPSLRTLKAVNLPGNQLLGLIGKNKKSNTSSNLIGGIPEARRSISLPDNKRAAVIEGGAVESNERKFIRLTDSGKGAIRVQVDENKSSGSGRPVSHSKQGASGKNTTVDSEISNERGSNTGTPPVNPLRTVPSRSEKALPRPTGGINANSRLTKTSTSSSLQENPWGKLTRIPLKHVIIPKNQVVQLSIGASWVTSIADIEPPHSNLPPGTPDTFMPSTLEHGKDTAGHNSTTPGLSVEYRQSSTYKHILSDGSPKRVEMSSPRKHYLENQRPAKLGIDVAFQTTDPLVVLDAVGTEEDDAVSWAPTSRASSVGPSPENEIEPSITSDFPPPHSNIHSPETANQVPIPGSSVCSPDPKLSMDSNVLLPSTLPDLSNQLDIESENGMGLKRGESLANNVVHSSLPYSEDDMEQRVPYAIGDVIQSSDDIYLSRIPASALTVSPTGSQQSPVLQIERTPYSRSQKDQPSLPETRFLRSPLVRKNSTPSPRSSAGSIILGTFNWDVGKHDVTAGNSLMYSALQQGHDEGHQATDVPMVSSAGVAVERSERLSTLILDHPPILVDAGGERGELCGETGNRTRETVGLHTPGF
ncbi:hypothetical protein V496_00406 [Pseudogymnoascus sp. VKM F-4515 (FW-2607)]|nr:hypothetical protein V496_00406 [Pseudogymnoascus sp. VKM F-4515 (FW-2607)]